MSKASELRVRVMQRIPARASPGRGFCLSAQPPAAELVQNLLEIVRIFFDYSPSFLLSLRFAGVVVFRR